MTKENDKYFKNSTKCYICDNTCFFGEVKVRDNCYITGRQRCFAHRDCYINVKSCFVYRLKNYDSHFILQELGKFGLKIDVISYRLKKYLSFNIYDKLIFIDNFQCVSFSLVSLVKNVGKADFNYLSQEFDNKVLGLVKHKEFYPYDYMSDFEKFKEGLPSKEKCYSLLVIKIMNMFLRFGIHFK